MLVLLEGGIIHYLENSKMRVGDPVVFQMFNKYGKLYPTLKKITRVLEL